MFTLSVAFGNISWLLAFHKQEDAEAAAKKLMLLPASATIGIQTNELATITDDFGQIVQCKVAPLGIFIEDLAKSKALQIDYRMHQARIQKDFQSRAEADAGLRANRGPSVLTPMPMSPMRGN